MQHQHDLIKEGMISVSNEYKQKILKKPEEGVPMFKR